MRGRERAGPRLLLLAALLLSAARGPTWAGDARRVWLGEPRQEDLLTVVPLLIDDLGQVVAIDLELVFDSRSARVTAVRPTSLLSGFLLAHNVVGDTLLVAAAGFAAGEGSGPFLEIAVAAAEPPRFGLVQVSLNGDQLPVTFERAQSPGPPTATVVTRTELAPGVFALAQNHPNPFNATTAIRWSLAQDGPARVEVLDLLGRPVRTLVSTWLAAGSYQASWDGCDADRRSVASGVYLCRLVAARSVLTRRLVLVR